jgi:tRNA A37 threonylcarbamoyladenosine dehydratase
MVIGCGGVGSFAAEALARTGVGKISLVDFDLVCVTNANRQLHAMRGTIGRAKVDVMAERLKLIHPTSEIAAIAEFYNHETSDQLLALNPTVIIDAIDNLTAKSHLLVQCKERGLLVVSAMGAAARMDPTKVRVDDLARTRNDPFAAALRSILREKYQWEFKHTRPLGIAAVYSEELPIAPSALSYDADEGFHCVCPQSDNGLHTCEKRSRIEGSVSWVTGTFGLVTASVAVRLALENSSMKERNISQNLDASLTSHRTTE